MENLEPQFSTEDDLIASNLLLRIKLEMEFDVIVNDELPFEPEEQHHLLRYLYAVETVLRNVTRGKVQDFASGNYYFRNGEDW